MTTYSSHFEPMICTDSVCSVPSGMEYYENRLRTFETYPKQMLPDKYQLARVGFYYTKESDIVICFRCRVKVSSWERDDIAGVEHLKWSPNCDFMKMIGPEKHGVGAGGNERPLFGRNTTPSFGFGSLTGANLFSNK
jgi:hypothetical protein